MSKETTINQLYSTLKESELSNFYQKVFVLYWLEDINFHSECKELQEKIFSDEEKKTYSDMEFDQDIYKKVSSFSSKTGWGCELYGKPLINEILNHFK